MPQYLVAIYHPDNYDPSLEDEEMVRDIDVLKETVPDLAGKPANLVQFPKTRDKAWLALFGKHSGRVDEAFAFDAYSSAPLAAFPSCVPQRRTSRAGAPRTRASRRTAGHPERRSPASGGRQHRRD